MRRIARYFIGVDLHKTIVQICILDRTGEIVRQIRYRVIDRFQGEELFDLLDQYLPTSRVAVEAIGVNRWFVNGLLDRGVDVVVCDPAKLNLKMLGRKTDRRDALEIARRLLLGDIDRNATTFYPDDVQYGQRKLLRTRSNLVRMRQQVVNQIRALLNAFKITGFTGRLTSKKNLVKLSELQLVTDELTVALQGCVSLLISCNESIALLEQKLRDLSQTTLPSILQDIPGVGPVTALTLVYELGDVHRFKNSRSVSAYGGLVPRVSQSADKAHHGALTKRGNRQLRYILGEWAMRLLATDARVKFWAKRRLARSHKNKVRMALARRLLIGVYKTLRTGEVFSLERCLA